MAKRARSEAEWGEIAAIGARLRKARRDAGLSQTALALRLNVRQPDISDWERGVHLPDPRVIAQWANVTDCDLDDLHRVLLSSPQNSPHASFGSSPVQPSLLADATAA